MANVVNPWIAPYLIAIAEDHGANIPSIPSYKKSKRVQLTEWLTYGTNDDDDSLLWAKISDKELSIPIRFSNNAIAEYNRLNHRRITQHKTAIVAIKDFKPFFTRVPRGGNMKLTNQSILALDCDSVSLLGSYDEALFGSPREVETNNDLRLWSEGLRQDGGGGNVLRQRKDAKQASAVLDTAPQPILVPPKQDKHTSNVTPRPLISKAQRKTSHIDLLRRHERLFRGKLRVPSSLDATALLMDEDDALPKHQESVTGVLQQEKTHVPNSPCEHRRPSPQHVLSSDSPPKIQSRQSSPGIPITNWSPSPSPAPRPPPTSWAPPVAQNSFVLSTPAQRQKNTSVPPESEVIAHETVLLPPPTITQLIHDKYPVIRKVPRPPQPMVPHESDFGPTQILVPNSDTSLSFSQSQPPSQSQSHSLEEVPECSQPVILSQLSALSKPRNDIDTTNPFVERASDPDADGGRDTAAKEDPLFSGTLDEENPYEGDQSSPDRANEESPKQIHVNGSCSQPPTYSIQPSVTQRHAEDRLPNIVGNDTDIGQQATAEAQSATEPLSIKKLNHDSMTIDVTQDLDEDYAQIRRELSSPSYSSQPRNSPQQHSPPEECPLSPARGIGVHAGADYSQSVLNSSTAVIADSRRSTPNGTLGAGVSMVQHDADAWSAPSFLRPSSSNNIRTHRSTPSFIDTAPQKMGKLKTANRKPTDWRLKASFNREASFPRSRPPRVDQNQAPGAPGVSQQPTQAQKKTSLASVLTSLQSRPNKRTKDMISDTDGAPESSCPREKKRRVERTESINNAQTRKIAHVKPSVLNNGRGVKLKGYTVDLGGFVLDEVSQPLVSWLSVKDILLKTSRDRDEET